MGGERRPRKAAAAREGERRAASIAMGAPAWGRREGGREIRSEEKNAERDTLTACVFFRRGNTVQTHMLTCASIHSTL